MLAASVMIVGFAAFLGRAVLPIAAAPQSTRPAPELYATRVQPIFQANCYRCHGGFNHRGGLQMETQAGLLKGGAHGPAIVPGHPEQSLLLKLIRHADPAGEAMAMPPKGRLSDADVGAVEQWIQAGAAMPPSPADR